MCLFAGTRTQGSGLHMACAEGLAAPAICNAGCERNIVTCGSVLLSHHKQPTVTGAR